MDAVTDHGDHVTVSHTWADGVTATAKAARAFICIGFSPNVEGIGLEAAGVRVTTTGTVDIEHMRASASHIFAAGDVSVKG